MSSNFETYITEFNFKLFNFILTTGQKLFKWNKRNSACCIYCNANDHDEYHLLYNCPHLENVWVKISKSMGLDINFKVILTGKNATIVQNQVISLLCCLLYKKFIKDINELQSLSVKQYLVNELTMKLNIYKRVTTNDGKDMIRKVINSLSM